MRAVAVIAASHDSSTDNSSTDDSSTDDSSTGRGRPARPGPEALYLTDVPDPVAAPDEVVIAVAAAGVNRADLLQRQGLYPPPPGASDVIGLEVAGTIAAIGDDVSGWAVGDECVALLSGGGYAEQVAVPACQVLVVPHGVDLVTVATLIEVAATVVSNFDAVDVRHDDLVLIHGGAGGVGSFAIQYAKAIGCQVATTAGSEAKRRFCRELGADIVLDHHSDWVTELSDATDGHGADVIVDVMGASYLEPNLAALATSGRLVVIGMQGGTSGTLDLGALLAKRGVITATSLRARPAFEKRAICCRVNEVVWPLITDGRIRPAPVERFAFEDAASAHARLESGQSMGKLALVW